MESVKNVLKPKTGLDGICGEELFPTVESQVSYVISGNLKASEVSLEIENR
jgi:hypothetical protein